MSWAENVAWAAGIFEGEGTFTRNGRTGKKWAANACVRMTDEDVVRRFAAVMGFGSVTGPLMDHGSPKPYWSWRVGSKEHFQATVAMFWPRLGVRRRARAKELLIANNARVGRWGGAFGRRPRKKECAP